jgi:hypothetical protein
VVNPLITVLFDLFLIGSAAAIVAAMVTEQLAGRTPHIGAWRRRAVAPAARRENVVLARQRRSRAPVRGWQLY